MKSTLIKYKILKALHEQEDHTPNAPILTQTELQKKTNISDNVIFDVCKTLKYDNQIEIANDGTYKLTYLGRQSAYNRYYKYKATEERWTNVKDIILIVVSVGSFLAGIIFGVVDRSEKKTIRQLQQKVDSIDSILKSKAI